MSSAGSRPHACAWRACDLPISRPSGVTAAFSERFCALKGATFRPRRKKIRQRAATRMLFPTAEEVPWIMRVFAVMPV